MIGRHFIGAPHVSKVTAPLNQSLPLTFILFSTTTIPVLGGQISILQQIGTHARSFGSSQPFLISRSARHGKKITEAFTFACFQPRFGLGKINSRMHTHDSWYPLHHFYLFTQEENIKVLFLPFNSSGYSKTHKTTQTLSGIIELDSPTHRHL
jgi:hypothetical protein